MKAPQNGILERLLLVLKAIECTLINGANLKVREACYHTLLTGVTVGLQIEKLISPK